MTPKNSSENPLSQIPPENIITFRNGIPGFPEETRFVLLQKEEERPFAWLQSVVTPKLAFVVASPFTFFPDYRPDVPDSEIESLGSPSLQEILVLAILRVLSTEPPQLHTNLKAPLIINLRTLAASQVILMNEGMYSERAIHVIK